MATKRKLAVLQLDSCDHEYLQQNLDCLPNLKRLFGTHGLQPLQTEQFAGSTSTTFNTGKSSNEHGVYFQLQWDPQSMRLRSLDPDWVGDLTPFWRKGKMRALKGIVLDPAFTFSGATSPHLEILGWSVHSSLVSYECNDPTLSQSIQAKHGLNLIGNESQIERGPIPRTVERDAMKASARTRGKLLVDLINTRDWDFLYAVFGETHRAGHVLWPSPGITPPDALLDVFKAVDESVGAIVSALPEGTDILVFAVQGMGHQAAQGHLCRPLLEAALSSMGYASAKFKARQNMIALLRQTIPARLQWEIRHRIPLRWRDRIVARQYASGLVPGETIAFPLQSDNHGYWRLLVKGRDAQGTLDEAEAQSIRQRFGEILTGFRSPNGEPLVNDVLFPSMGDGTRSHLLPDVVAAWNPEIQQVSEAHHPTAGIIRGTPDAARTGNHTFRGFYSFNGRQLDDAMRPKHVSDLAGFIEELVG